jgi:Tfp pilus assembly protein FimT
MEDGMHRSSFSASGFTTIEMIIVVIIVGAIAVMGFPRLRDAVDKQNFRSARLAVVSYVSTARGAAVARGCRSNVHFVSGPNSRMWVTSCRFPVGTPGSDTLAGPEWTEQRWNARLYALKDSITFDPRGLRLTLVRTTIKLRNKADQDRDSVVVNEIGKVVRQ